MRENGVLGENSRQYVYVRRYYLNIQRSAMKRFFTKQAMLEYLYSALSGRLLGFVVGAWATGFLSKFFETRGIQNLWGLKSKKVLLDKGTFENLEWIVSVVIGYFVFEIFEKVVRERIRTHWPVYYKKGKEYWEEKGYNGKLEEIRSKANTMIKEKAAGGREKVNEECSRLRKKNKDG